MAKPATKVTGAVSQAIGPCAFGTLRAGRTRSRRTAHLLAGAAVGVLAAFACGTARAQQGPFLYVPDSLNNTVTVIDTSTNAVVPPGIPTGGLAPQFVGVSGDESLFYVSNPASGTVTPISNNIAGPPIPIPGATPQGVAITPDGKTAYVADGITGNVSVINTATNTVIGSPIFEGANADRAGGDRRSARIGIGAGKR
jgi:YVTN family beta-propeller protein